MVCRNREAEALRDAGLVDVQLTHPPTTLHHVDADAACDAAFLSGPVALAYSRFESEAGLTIALCGQTRRCDEAARSARDYR